MRPQVGEERDHMFLFGSSFKYPVGVVLTTCWDLESRPIQLSRLGARIVARGWGLHSQLNIPDLDIEMTGN